MGTHGLEKIETFEKLLVWLHEELFWPIDKLEIENETLFDDLTFEYDLEKDLGLKNKDIAHIREINQLRPLISNQPWGIFFVSLEDKKIPVGVLKRVLGGLTLKKRQSANKSDQKGWHLHDLLFISAHGENEERHLSFLHFSEENGGKNKIILKELGWDLYDRNLKLTFIAKNLKSNLTWPDDTNDSKAWREKWSSTFTSDYGSAIKTAKSLTKVLAKLAINIKKSANDILRFENYNGPLTSIWQSFRQNIFHNLTSDDFADMYAQTICYGLLAASINKRGETLVADDAALVLPLTQPFLKDLMETFLAVGGRKSKIDFNELGIDEVVEALREADMKAVLLDFDKRNPNEDPILHFYEHFLKEYDAIMREQRGVYYTPLPVVKFIVRSIDEILQEEFNLKDGLADTTTWGEISANNSEIKIPEGVSAEDPFVQILDPATGTGTFLVEVINLIEERMKNKWKHESKNEQEINCLWNDYVPKHLLPRLNGFELMMAPYAIAHIKIGMKLTETGYQPKTISGSRVRVYLTNTLEEPAGLGKQINMHFISESLAEEARGADCIKTHTPITVVIGNPPYSPHNENRNPCIKNGKKTFIGELIDSYYYVDKVSINESNSKNIKADENKFIRYGEYKINTSGIGILGYVSASAYLDTPTMRAMRWNLLQSFKHINILNLHGNVRRKETSPDGSKDENVFDIQQGVAICLMRRLAKEITIIKHADLWGSRHKQGLSNGKYGWLYSNSIYSTLFNSIEPRRGQFIFTPIESGQLNEYENAFTPVDKIFKASNSGFKTHRDHFALAQNEKEIKDRIDDLCNDSLGIEELRKKYELKDNGDWKLEKSRKALKANLNKQDKIRLCMYRPFDIRYCYYGEEVMDRPREETLQHLLGGGNVACVIGRQGLAIPERPWEIVFATKYILDTNLYRRGGNRVFPLYLMPSKIETTMRPNLDFKFAEDFAKSAGLNYDSSLMNGCGDLAKTCGARDVFDFIYAVLHSLSYRTRYADFLKSDFPRIPLSNSVDLLRELVGLGRKLVALHLFDTSEAKMLVQKKVQFIADGHAQVKKGFPKYEDGKVMINQHCHFESITPSVWSFHIGGYQICEKWLKDRGEKGGKNPRPGRVLTNEDIEHYQKIIVAISETIRIMAKIDEVIEEHGGWPGAFVTE